MLLTLEGRRIHQSRIIPITASVQVVEIPVTKDLAPNIHVSASTISNGRFYHQQGLLKVEYQPGKLDLTVTPQQPVYALAIRQRSPSVARLKANRFRQKSRWPWWTKRSLPWHRRPVKRSTASSVDGGPSGPHHLFLPAALPGGASKDLAKLAETDDLKGIKVRKVFKDTAAWLPMLASDVNGIVTAETKLPDNLTKWRATAVGHTAEQQFGSGQASFISRLPFMARLAPPRFMVAEDRLEIPGLLNDARAKSSR